MANFLVLVRHGQSEWNLKNLFTGWADPPLTDAGVTEAKTAGMLLHNAGLFFDVAYTSELKRARDTLDLMLDGLWQAGLEIHTSQALNERDYGDLVGLNKAEASEKWGEDQVHQWRRSYDVAPPGGESLKDTAMRVLPFFNSRIVNSVLAGDNVLVVAHGNSLRAIIMELEKLSPDEIVERELKTGVPQVYWLNEQGAVTAFEEL